MRATGAVWWNGKKEPVVIFVRFNRTSCGFCRFWTEWFRTWSRVMSITYHARLRLWECGGKRRRSGCRVVRHDRERKRNQDFLGRARCGNLLWNRAGNLPERSMSTILSNRINRSLSEVEMIGLRLRSANFIISKKWVDKPVNYFENFLIITHT